MFNTEYLIYGVLCTCCRMSLALAAQ